ELPCLPVCTELLLISRIELTEGVFIRVNRRLILAPVFKRPQPGAFHLAELRQFRHTGDVDGAPVADRLSRRETDAVTLVIDATSHAVDPSEAECLIDRLGPGDRWFSGILFIETDQELGCRGVVFRKPFAEGGGGRKEDGLH